MKPAGFQYVKAVNVQDAVTVLDDHAGAARLLAGGQSLVPMLGMRLLRPEVIVDLNGLTDELGQIELRGEELMIGALVRYGELERSPIVREHLPLLQHVVGYIGDRQVRNRGTLGGAIAQADPTGEAALASLVLGARVLVASRGGERVIPLEDLFLGSYWTALEPDELVTHVVFPRGGERCGFFERGRKHNDFALIAVAAVADRDPIGVWHGVRLGLGGAADTPILARQAMALLEDSIWDAATIEQAAQLAADASDPPTDARASAEYRRHLVNVHVRRTLTSLEASDG